MTMPTWYSQLNLNLGPSSGIKVKIPSLILGTEKGTTGDVQARVTAAIDAGWVGRSFSCAHATNTWHRTTVQTMNGDLIDAARSSHPAPSLSPTLTGTGASTPPTAGTMTRPRRGARCGPRTRAAWRSAATSTWRRSSPIKATSTARTGRARTSLTSRWRFRWNSRLTRRSRSWGPTTSMHCSYTVKWARASLPPSLPCFVARDLWGSQFARLFPVRRVKRRDELHFFFNKKTPISPFSFSSFPFPFSFSFSFSFSLFHVCTRLVLVFDVLVPIVFCDRPERMMEVWRGMEVQFHQGRVRTLGISLVDAGRLNHLLREATVKPAIVQNRYSADNDFDSAVRKISDKENIVYQAFGVVSSAHGGNASFFSFLFLSFFSLPFYPFYFSFPPIFFLFWGSRAGV